MRQKIIAILAMLLTVGNSGVINEAESQTAIIEPISAAVITEVKEVQVKEAYSTNPSPSDVQIEQLNAQINEREDIIDMSVKNLKASTISVSCIKVEWEAEEGIEYDIAISTTANFQQNIAIVKFREGLCYLTGLREGSNYDITITPKQFGRTMGEFSKTVRGYTEKVNIIQIYQYEEGWTNCYAGEKASGLTRMPSVGAITGTICDPITGTGIRRNQYGDYCCAMGLWYGMVGDRFLIETMNGEQFTVQICDSKGMADDADGDNIPDGRFHWYGGTGVGKCIVEFIYDDDNLPATVAYSGSWGFENWSGLDLTYPIANIKKIEYGNSIEY